jgi:hypothetical protein
MSIAAMKQALQALDLIDKDIEWHDKSPTRKFCNQAAHFLRQAIEQEEDAVAAEREACARLVEADGLARGAEGYMLTKAATRIRARGET